MECPVKGERKGHEGLQKNFGTFKYSLACPSSSPTLVQAGTCGEDILHWWSQPLRKWLGNPCATYLKV